MHQINMISLLHKITHLLLPLGLKLWCLPLILKLQPKLVVKTMEEELQVLQENHIWDMVSCPSVVKPIGCKWIYTIKLKFDGSLEQYKGLLWWFLVINKKLEWIMNMNRHLLLWLRWLLLVCAPQWWPLLHMDVKNFFYMDIWEKIFMTSPQGLLVTPSYDGCCSKQTL